MPASQNRSDWRGRRLQVLFWTGVGLAPLAALFLLLGQGGGPLRLAAVLAILCVVLIGLSVALRNDVDSMRAQLEAMVLDEVDAVRDQTREDIVAVARKLHATLRDEVADLADQVDELREHPQRNVSAAPATRAAAVRPVSGTARPVSGAAPVPAAGRRPEPGRWQDSPRPAAAAWSAGQTGDYPDGRYRRAQPAAGDARRWDPPGDSPDSPGTGWSTDSVGVPTSPSPVSASPVSPGPGFPRPVSAAPSGGDQYPGYSYSGGRRVVEPESPTPVAAIESGRQSGQYSSQPVGQRSADPWADLRGAGPPTHPPASSATPNGPEYGGPAHHNGHGHPNGHGYQNGYPAQSGHGYQNGHAYQNGYGSQNDHAPQTGEAFQNPGYPDGSAGYSQAAESFFGSYQSDPPDPRWR